MNKDVKICEYETGSSECKEVITYPYGNDDSTEAWIRGNELLPKTSKCPNAAAMKFDQYYMSKSDNTITYFSKYLPLSMNFGHFFKGLVLNYVEKKKVGRWFLKCQLYSINKAIL